MNTQGMNSKSQYQDEVVDNFQLERSKYHQAEIRRVLGESVLGTCQPLPFVKSNESKPLIFLTGASAQQFNAEIHQATITKNMMPLNNEHYMLNQSAALLPELLEKTDSYIIVQSKPASIEILEKLFKAHVKSGRLQFIAQPTDSDELLQKFYRQAEDLCQRQPISRLDLVLYESFAAGVVQPFKPIYTEDPNVVGNAVLKRAKFFHNMCLLAYHLALNCNQTDIRIVALTALAARRVGGNLLADAAHKQISTNYLETFAKEASFHLPDTNVSCVEIAPGIVDNGIYDDNAARLATLERASINGHAFRDVCACKEDICALPKLNPVDIGAVAIKYLFAEYNENIHDDLSDNIKDLAAAGRSTTELQDATKKLADNMKINGIITDEMPSWFLTNGNGVGRFPPLRTGYQFIPICPKGQRF